VFYDQAHAVKCEGELFQVPTKTWVYLWLELTYDILLQTTTITMMSNNFLTGEIWTKEKYILIDYPGYRHYIGGILEDWKLYNTFCGFLYEVYIANTAENA
jgi:hypothetical protein